MNQPYLSGIIAFITASVATFLITPSVIKIAWKFKLIDDPKTNKHPKVIHTKPIPRGGGLAIFFGLFVAASIFLPIDKRFIGIFLGAIIIVIYGLLDDRINLNPYARLALQFSAAVCPIIAGVGISFLTNPLGGIIDLSQPRLVLELGGSVLEIWILADLFALGWIVFLMNILNMGAKGIDGQLTGTAVIGAVIVALLSLRFISDPSQWSLFILALIVAGAFTGFLPWHAYPQKIMPSFSGSNLAGYFLAVLSILSTTKVGVIVVALGIPIIDTIYTITRRIAQGKSPVWGDRGHLHHRLLDAGLSKKEIMLFYWISTAVLGLVALNLNAAHKFYTIIGVACALLGIILLLKLRAGKK